MGTVNTNPAITEPNVVAIRCGRHRQDGSRCRKAWFYGVGTTGEIVLIPKDAGWTGGHWHGARLAAADPFSDEARWEIVCTRHCGAHPTVKKGTLEREARDAARRGEQVIWLTDIAS
jgi:hypothetical protein